MKPAPTNRVIFIRSIRIHHSNQVVLSTFLQFKNYENEWQSYPVLLQKIFQSFKFHFVISDCIFLGGEGVLVKFLQLDKPIISGVVSAIPVKVTVNGLNPGDTS